MLKDKITLVPTLANFALLIAHKKTLESSNWNYKLLPAVKYAEYMAERSAVYEEHKGDRDTIIALCADIYNNWEDKNIPLCVKINDEEVTLVDINKKLAEITPYLTHKEVRSVSYPPMEDYLDGIVKNDTAQIAKYISDCLAVKAKYPERSYTSLDPFLEAE
jgi:hypothetical protein